MKQCVLVLLVLCISVFNSAFAAKVMMGDKETIHKIKDIMYEGEDGAEYFLGYKTTMKSFIAGLYLSDDGYVLGVKGKPGSYIPLNNENIAMFQEAGYLADPLPEYKISLTDYALGFSLWIIIIFFVGYSFIKYKFSSR